MMTATGVYLVAVLAVLQASRGLLNKTLPALHLGSSITFFCWWCPNVWFLYYSNPDLPFMDSYKCFLNLLISLGYINYGNNELPNSKGCIPHTSWDYKQGFYYRRKKKWSEKIQPILVVLLDTTIHISLTWKTYSLPSNDHPLPKPHLIMVFVKRSGSYDLHQFRLHYSQPRDLYTE